MRKWLAGVLMMVLCIFIGISNAAALTWEEVADGNYTRQDIMSAYGITQGADYRREDTGAPVMFIQSALKILDYYYGDITGSFDYKTENAVLEFEGKNSLPADGVCDSESVERLIEVFLRANPGKEECTHENADSVGEARIGNVQIEDIVHHKKQYNDCASRFRRGYRCSVAAVEIGVSLRTGLDALASIQTFSFSSAERASSTILLSQRSAVSMVSSVVLRFAFPWAVSASLMAMLSFLRQSTAPWMTSRKRRISSSLFIFSPHAEAAGRGLLHEAFRDFRKDLFECCGVDAAGNNHLPIDLEGSGEKRFFVAHDAFNFVFCGGDFCFDFLLHPF